MYARMARTMLLGSLAVSTLLMVPVAAHASEDMRGLAAAHRQAATEAQQKATYHDQMRSKAAKRPQAGKFNMVKHCKRWGTYYRKMAAKNTAAATKLEQQIQ